MQIIIILTKSINRSWGSISWLCLYRIITVLFLAITLRRRTLFLLVITLRRKLSTNVSWAFPPKQCVRVYLVFVYIWPAVCSLLYIMLCHYYSLYVAVFLYLCVLLYLKCQFYCHIYYVSIKYISVTIILLFKLIYFVVFFFYVIISYCQ